MTGEVVTNPLTEAILARLRSGRRAFGVYLIPGFPDWPAGVLRLRPVATGGRPAGVRGVIVGSAALDSLSQGPDRFSGWLGDMLAAT